jgi:chromosome segregation ATPase
MAAELETRLADASVRHEALAPELARAQGEQDGVQSEATELERRLTDVSVQQVRATSELADVRAELQARAAKLAHLYTQVAHMWGFRGGAREITGSLVAELLKCVRWRTKEAKNREAAA